MPATDSALRPVMVLAGGTGGHIFPGLAVAHALQARGVPVSWLGADGGMETRLVPQHGVAIDTIAVRGVRGKGIASLLAAPFRLVGAVRAAAQTLRQRQPRAVVSFGGYAAGPGGLAARLLGVPLFVHEQNRAPGMTNRVLSRMADALAEWFPAHASSMDAGLAQHMKSVQFDSRTETLADPSLVRPATMSGCGSVSCS